MAKDTEVVEGGPLMDPNGEAFAAMLSQAQTRGEEALAVTPDVSPGEVSKDVKVEESVSSTEETTETGDPEALKAQLSGLQAELARVRKLKTGNEGEAGALRETLAEMQGQLKVLREGKTEKTLADSLRALPDDQVQENEILWQDELADARVVARLAERDRDDTALFDAQKRITTARKMQKLYDTEKQVRVEGRVEQKKSLAESQGVLSSEVDSLFKETYLAIPELQDNTSEIWKAGQAEYKLYPALMKQLGPLGEMIAVASAVAKNPNLVGKKAAAKLLANLDQVADKSFMKGGTAPKLASVRNTTISSQNDLSAFEAQVAAVKQG